MGNIGLTKHNKTEMNPPITYPVKVETRGCHYCNKDINKKINFLSCTKCAHKMHTNCYSVSNNLNYSKCPRCSTIGSIFSVNGNSKC